MRTLTVLLHHGSSRTPTLRQVAATDELTGQLIADELLAGALDGVGVEVWRGQQRIYARGVLPSAVVARPDTPADIDA